VGPPSGVVTFLFRCSLAAVSAPSSLAVLLAEESGITLLAFLREDSMSVYTRADRIT
jgi:FdhD protein